MRRALSKHKLDSDLYEMIPALIIALSEVKAAEQYLAGEGVFETCKVPSRDLDIG